MTTNIKRDQLHSIEGSFCFICNLFENIIASPITYILIPVLIATGSVFFLTDINIKLTLLMWALACMIIGAFIGFLFGLPKRIQNSDNKNLTQKTDDATLRPNTNLQEISDWLTKIIIGIGLIQFNQIYQSINSLALKIGSSMQGIEKYDYSMYALALIIFFVTSGFLAGYLGTVIKISHELSKADKAIFGKQIDNLKDHIAEIERRVRKHEDISNMVSVAEKYITKAEIYLDTEKTKDELKSKSKKFLDMSRIILEQVLNNDDEISNIPAVFALEHYYINLDTPNYDKAIEILTRAITHIEGLNDDKHSVALHRLYYNRACSKYSKTHNFNEAKSDLIHAIYLQSFYRQFALFDDDWKDILDNDEFTKIINS